MDTKFFTYISTVKIDRKIEREKSKMSKYLFTISYNMTAKKKV